MKTFPTLHEIEADALMSATQKEVRGEEKNQQDSFFFCHFYGVFLIYLYPSVCTYIYIRANVVVVSTQTEH